MSDYTPTTEEVREAYLDRKDFEDALSFIERRGDEVAAAEFDRWLAANNAKVWQEGVAAQCEAYNMTPDPGPNPYRKDQTWEP